MQKSTTQLGPLETQLFAWIQLKDRNLMRTGEASRIFGLTPANETKLFSRLCRRQLALRLMNGLFLMPSKIPPGGKWGPNPYWVLAHLMNAVDAKYQVTGAAAFHRYGFSEQVPNQITVYNTKLSGRRKIGGTSYELIKVAADRLGKIEMLKINEGIDIPFSDAGRTLMDVLYDWSRFGAFPRVLDWIESRAKNKELVRNLIQATVEFSNIGTVRRVGYILENIGVNRQTLRPLTKQLTEAKSFIPLNPSKPKRGQLNKTWGLIINDQ